MSTQSPYLNAIIIFPLITQVNGSSIAILLNAVVTFDINGKKSSFSRLLLFFVTRVQVI